MRKVVATEFVTLDGVMEAQHEWSFPYWNDEIGQYKNDELFASDAMLLGRVTYEGFAEAWPSREGEFADRFNNMPKYVVSTTLDEATWNNSTVIKENVAEEVAKLKEQPGKDIVIHGSNTLVRTLTQDGLIDEYKLLVYPIVLGRGKRLFQEWSEAKLELAEAKAMGSGVVALIYRPA